jgi:hypothetical protein
VATREAGPLGGTAEARLSRELAERGLSGRAAPAGGAAEIRLVLEPGLGLRRGGYRLEVGAKGATVSASDEAGVLYGAATLGQWLRLAGEPVGEGGEGLAVPGLRVEDWPDFPCRGVLLDVSRDRVPTLETLRDLIERLSSWKVNQLQLYMEHTFAYRGHEAVWEGASPLTADEIRGLDAFCRERAVELVACQQSFGHLHRWLKREPYRRLAECPAGIEHPWSAAPEPYGLCPTDPGSRELIADLLDQLLPCFASAQVNVGFDEPIDLGRCRSAAALAERGAGRLYLDFLEDVRRLAGERGRRIQFWGDFVGEHPELLAEVPRDAVVLEWGYEADHPFAERCRALAAAGLETYVCPGTSSWNSFAGRADNALGNLAAAARAGKEHGAAGFLVCDWGDNGHLQPLPASELGFLVGAGYAWSAGAAGSDIDPAALLDTHAFGDRAGVAGGVTLALADAYRLAGGRNRNGTALFFLLLDADRPISRSRAAGVTAAGLSEVRQQARAAMAALGRAAMARPDGRLVADELAWVGEAFELACRLGTARLGLGADSPLASLSRSTRWGISLRARALAGRHRALWIRRSRPGGLADSAARLERLQALLTGEASPRP